MNKKTSISNNFVWSLAEKAGRYGITLITTIILARILEPEEFGLIAIVTGFITIANVFVQNGFGFAVIQKKDATNKDFTFVLGFNLVISLILYIIFFFVAPVVENFYNMEGLSMIIRIMFLSIIIAAIGNIQQAYVSRNLEFKKLFVSTFSAVIASGIIGVVMAYIGCGVWSLVVQQISYNLICVIVLYLNSGLKLERGVTFIELKGTLSLGGKFLLTSLILALRAEIRTLTIGKLYGATDLAYVNKGQRLTNAPMSVIQSSITAVMYPVLAKYQDQLDRIRDILRRFMQVSSYIIFPTLFVLAAIADSIVPLLLTEKWNGSVPYVVLYCFIWMFNPIQMAHLQAIKAIGKGNILVALEVAKTIVSFAILCITIFFYDSIIAIVVGLLISEIICTLFTCPIGKKLFQYSYFNQMKDIISPLAMSLIMFLVAKTIEFLPLGAFPTLLIQILVSIVIYWMLSIIFKPSGYNLAKDMTKGYIDKFKKSK